MDHKSKQTQSFRFKSSEALKDILKKNREFKKQYYTKPAFSPCISQEIKANSNHIYDHSQSLIFNYCESPNKSSQVSIAKHNPALFLKDFPEILGNKLYKTVKFTKKFDGFKPKPKKAKNSLNSKDIRTITPDFFRKALHGVLKVPGTSNSRKKTVKIVDFRKTS